ncbi:MAG: succinate dehydrogenase assembly factor 2 [Gammaproteobacteria bacterium]|nr:succinate dehydrogenase assembly factor 2 [Gammaproteobacteria bacterium]
MTKAVTIEQTDRDQQRARLKWQCRRGMLELDMFLQAFLDKCYENLTQEERLVFTALLEFPDQELLEYLMLRKTPDEKEFTHVIKQIREAAGP